MAHRANNVEEFTMKNKGFTLIELMIVVAIIAIIAAIALTLRERKDSKFIDPSDQIRVKKAQRLRIVSVQANVDTAPPAAQEQS